MHFYGDINEYLSHHGILGQKWGKRNGPPYPLNGESHSLEEQKQFVEELSKELDNEWDYGVIHDGKKVIDLEGFDFGKNYRTIPVETLEKEKIGLCWDFVNYQHHKLKQMGIKDRSYFIDMDLRSPENPNRYVTHTWTMFDLGGKTYWLESAAYPKRGLHEVKDFKSVAEEIRSIYTDDPKPYTVYQYNPDGLDKGLTDLEFVDQVRTDENWVGNYNYKDEDK